MILPTIRSASADEPYLGWKPPATKLMKAQSYNEYRRWRREQREERRYERREPAAACLPPVKGLGAKNLVSWLARRSARLDWSRRVIDRASEQYVDLGNARNVDMQCREVGRFTRCTVTARPCSS